MKNSRARATKIICRVVIDKINLDEALSEHFAENDNDRSFIQELCYGTIRFYPRLNILVSQLLQKPFAQKDRDLLVLLLVGVYQLLYLDTPDHAAISETVEASKQINKSWAAKLINAVLRNFQRQREMLLAKAEANDVAQTAHPKWLIKELKKAYPNEWEKICAANNVKPPMTLRVNVQKISREEYLRKIPLNPPFSKGEIPTDPPFEKGGQGGFAVNALISPFAIYLSHPLSVTDLPGFTEGEISVQDEAAQLAAVLLDLKPNQLVLDACAAPGGKTCHILETEPTVKLIAVESVAKRAEKIHENLQRLKLSAEVIVADAAQPENWWDKQLFDRILLDAPCSATGVIRRHPDIKLLRKSEDIQNIVKTQAALLNALWPLLKPEGLLLYATCSILPAENSEQINTFISLHPDAELQTIQHPGKLLASPDWQLLPEINGHDGFYYALIKKKQIKA